MRQALAVAVVMAATGGMLSRLGAQEPVDPLMPRALADSTYAIHIAIDELATNIRHGRLDPRQFDQPELATAVGKLAGAASGRRAPRPDLGVLWEFRLEITQIEPAGPDILRVQVHAFLAGDAATGQAATLTYARHGDRWDLVAHEGLVGRLTELALGFHGGSGR